MADTSPDAAFQGSPKENGLVSKANTNSERKTNKSARGALGPPPRRLRGMWTPRRRNNELRKARNTRKYTRDRLSERVFRQIIHDIAKEIKPGIRFQPSAFAPLQEAVESFAVSYFSSMKICANHAMRVTILLEDSKLVKSMLGIQYPSHSLAKKEQSQPR
ncbi:hypothetical protein GGI43DRAFT_428064 [Trichoderma evansii]